MLLTIPLTTDCEQVQITLPIAASLFDSFRILDSARLCKLVNFTCQAMKVTLYSGTEAGGTYSAITVVISTAGLGRIACLDDLNPPLSLYRQPSTTGR